MTSQRGVAHAYENYCYGLHIKAKLCCLRIFTRPFYLWLLLQVLAWSGRSPSPPSSRGGNQMFQSIFTPSSSRRCRGRGGISFQQALSAREGAKKEASKNQLHAIGRFVSTVVGEQDRGTIKEYYSSPAQTYIIKLQLTSIKLRATRLDNFSDVVARWKRSLADTLGWFPKDTWIIKDVLK